MNKLEQKSILLVEDEILIAMAEAHTVKGFGYKVVIANSGEKALACGDSEIDIILMDIDLGKGINGPEAASEILEKRLLPWVCHKKLRRLCSESINRDGV
jgi:CheY-like chemotaxis protein